jgi:hypothetical protein
MVVPSAAERSASRAAGTLRIQKACYLALGFMLLSGCTFRCHTYACKYFSSRPAPIYLIVTVSV